jgi:hypothetical protein
MKSNTAAWLSLIACFAAVCFLLTPSVSTESIVLPHAMYDQGFTVTITYYYVSGPDTIVLIGTVKSPVTLMLKSLTGLAYINGVAVGSGIVDESYLQLTAGMAAPVSATVTTNFNIYDALWFGQITVGDGTTIPFHYASTPITVVLSGQLCGVLQGANCFAWPGFNQTSTLALL